MPVDRHALLRDLQKRVRILEDDVRLRLESPDGADQRASLVDEHRRAVEAERTAASWLEFRDDQVTQSAVAWVLATVFTRFCEDNDLVPDAWIAGPGERTRLAAERQQAFLVKQPLLNDRDWLLASFDHLAEYPALAALLDREHNPLHRLSISADAGEDLLRFWRSTDEEGRLHHDLTDADLSTRFLGDLYQDLSKSARDKYALLQTPEFVEEFILDQTLEPALADRPLESFKMIDPTCGSGHFLLGAFKRLLDRWSREAPGLDSRERVQRALDSIHGVDLNPAAIAIARFRLTVAAMRASRIANLSAAPAYRYHLAAGDALLHGSGQATILEDSDLEKLEYDSGERDDLTRLLTPGRYDAVVGNPPYITVRDPAVSRAYRLRYRSCADTYSLAVPFVERFFDLAKQPSKNSRAGWMGQITSNSFMKRGFGKKLVEQFLPTVDLRIIIDSEGAWIPGHNVDGTPTTILIGCAGEPERDRVRVVFSKGRRETRAMGEKGDKPYWSSIVQNVASAQWENDWVAISDVKRSELASHPLSLSGGRMLELRKVVETSSGRTLRTLISGRIGRAIRSGADEAFVISPSVAAKHPGLPQRSFVVGSEVRDWLNLATQLILYPYQYGTGKIVDDGLADFLWPFKAVLAARVTFQGVMSSTGREWWSYMQHTPSAYETPLSIVFAEVASHNHFVLDRGGRVFKQTAPIIKLRDGANESDHLAILSVLNSSTACFWLRDMAKPKGGAANKLWSRTHQFSGGVVERLPLPDGQVSSVYAGPLSRTVDQVEDLISATFDLRSVPTREELDAVRESFLALREQMIALQEELDWEVYQAYGLLVEPPLTPVATLPAIRRGERAFEITLARSVEDDEDAAAYLGDHGSIHTTEPPARWPTFHRETVAKRIDIIANDPLIAILERPEYKRRWDAHEWETLLQQFLGDWLLARLEEREIWSVGDRVATRSVAQLADILMRDEQFCRVMNLWSGNQFAPLEEQLLALVDVNHVPFLASFRHAEPGLAKRAVWLETWEQQRSDPESIPPAPPAYEPKDFLRQSYWAQRGKFDVARERFISYPGAERGADQTMVLGWSGWNYAEQGQALAALSLERAQREGWSAVSLTPLLAGLAELEPWLHQWHSRTDPRMGVSPAQAMTSTLDRELARLGLTRADLSAWRPQPSTRGRRPRTTQEA